MGARVFLLPHVHFIITFFFLLVFVPTSYCEEDEFYRECFTPFQCGNLPNLSYPFWGDERPEICGYQGFRLRCQEGPSPIITINDQEFYVKFVNQSERVMIISRKDLSQNVCPPGVAEILNTTLNETPFSYVPEFENVSLFYNCSNKATMVPTPYKISCSVNDEQRDAFYATDWLLNKWNQDPSDCNIRVEVPVPKVDVEQLISGGMEALSKALREGFNVTYMFETIPMCYECVHSGGICGTDSSTFRFTCLKAKENFVRKRVERLVCFPRLLSILNLSTSPYDVEHCSSLISLIFFVETYLPPNASLLFSSFFYSRWVLYFFISHKPLLICFIVFFFFFTTLAEESLSADQKFQACAPTSCGKGPNISYPFLLSNVQESFCGYLHFNITCNQEYPVLRISSDDYIIKDIFYDNQSFLVASSLVYEEDTCPIPLHNVTLDLAPFNISPGYIDFSFLYNCTSEPANYPIYPISCATNSTVSSFAGFHIEELELNYSYSLNSCNYFVNAPLHTRSDVYSLYNKDYTEILKLGFLLNWTTHNCSSCERSGGRCGFENHEFVCFCHDQTHLNSCDDGNSS
ncbi:uncharacterized protein LOC131182947 [Hevea brasiliensis]|uniref:uncharacterized protein LOC131182947 n=1 Tax=Hevea brasiliensis TaxID=3981 RepID=UPI0025F59CBC|nr:uncharacterized protein LOC131182947 [Hevea brasiliensis]